MFGYYYGFDWTYLVLVVPCIILALWAQHNVNSTFTKYSAVYSRRGITGAQAASIVLRRNGITNVRIEEIPGKLTDHYEPGANVIRLSNSVYHSTSVASIGVACHEAGHAVQYAKGYSPIRVRAAIIPLTRAGSALSLPLLLLGIILNSQNLAIFGIALFGLSTLFQLITLPVEINASRRALAAIQDAGILYDDEYPLERQTLTAAALTYVEALAVSLAQLLRLIILFGGRRDD